MTPKDEETEILNTPNVPCHICMKEVPASEIVSFEATDYVAYFCGLDCYDQWKNLTKNKQPRQGTFVDQCKKYPMYKTV